MGIGGGFAAHGAKAEALAVVAGGGLQLAVVEDEAFALALLDEKLAVIGFGQRLLGVAAGLVEGQVADGIERGHGENPAVERP